MDKLTVKKEKVIREFRDELKVRGIVNREIYELPFFQILNHVYKYHPRNITCHLNRLNNLTFLVMIDHTYIFIEWSPQKERKTLLSITIMDGEIEQSGIYTVSLEEALKNIDRVCKVKT
jgi:hypothetical protein